MGRYKKKGLSPVIATVLLIAIVIAMSLIIFLWFRGMTEEAITKTGGEHIKLTCDDVEFSAEYDSNEQVIYVTNDGTVPIYSIMIDAFYDGRHEAEDITEINTPNPWLAGGLKQGGTYSGYIGGHVGSGAEKLEIIPILIGNSDEGRKTYVCEDSRSIKEVVV